MCTFFAAPPAGSVASLATTDGEHGQIEGHRHHVCHDIDWLFSDRRYPDKVAFPGLAMIAMVEAETERGGKTSHERRYYLCLCSAKLDAATFALAVCAHWGIENRLHWVLDAVFRDDLARLGTGHGPQNMAVVKHFAGNLVHAAKPITNLKNRRKLAARDLDYLDALIRGIA